MTVWVWSGTLPGLFSWRALVALRVCILVMGVEEVTCYGMLTMFRVCVCVCDMWW